jgi:2-oxoisovalerate dehydrogenase E1 component
MNPGAILSPEQQRSLLELLLESRHGDLRQENLNRQGKGHFHVSGMGHEGMGVIARATGPGDMACMYYRDRAFLLGRGATTRELALDYFAKRDSSTGGRQVPSHGTYRKLGFWSVATPTGAQLLPACGMAWGMKLDGLDTCVVASVGDAATRQGDFFEAVCFARERALPVLFVVEDNGYGISSPTRRINPLALGALAPEVWRMVDGRSVQEMHRASVEAVARIRRGEGPACLWVRFERLSSHTSSDDQKLYRSAEELSHLAEGDPILRLRDDMIAAGLLTPEAYRELDQRIKEQVRQDYLDAERSDDPRPEELLTELIGPLPRLDAGAEVLPPGKYRLGDSVNLALRRALEDDSRVLLFGEDIEDPKGGVFRLTKGLSKDFPGRVSNSPLAESTILGVACGLATYGKRPVFELQFIDFIAPGWNQLVTNFSTLRWRSNGEWKCPAVIYAPCGAYLPGGSLWHSQTNEGAIAHFPGIRVVMPSTPEDAAGFFWTAIRAEDPTIILLPKHLLWAERELTAPAPPTPFGKARKLHSGNGVTLVGWGDTIEVCAEALRLLGDQADADFFDLRSIVPWDREALALSVEKTGRLVVVQEDTENCSVGQMIIASLAGDPAVWRRLQAPPALVSKGNVMIGYHPVLEFAALPNAERVAAALRAALGASPHTVSPKHSVDPAPAPATETETIILRVPQLGEGIRAVRIVRLLKTPGEAIAPDEPLCELETDKAVYPVEASGAGRLVEWKVSEGESVSIGAALAVLEYSAVPRGDKPAIARENAPPAPQPALSPAITRRLGQAAPVYLTVDARWEAVRAARRAAKERGEPLTPSLMAAWAIVRSMEIHSPFRRQFVDERHIVQLTDFDFGIAVALEEDRLVTAVMPDANRLSWRDFVDGYHAAIAEARGGHAPGEVRAPVILTSLGGFGVRSGQPLLVPPAVGTLFVGEAHYEMQASEGSGWPSAEEVVTLSLTFDHRVINGAGGAAFVGEVRRRIEEFQIPG